MEVDQQQPVLQLHGGYDTHREYRCRHVWMRDAKITEIYEGTSEVSPYGLFAGTYMK